MMYRLFGKKEDEAKRRRNALRLAFVCFVVLEMTICIEILNAQKLALVHICN